MSERWESEFDRLFYMDTDNGPEGGLILHRVNADGSVSFALAGDVKQFIARQLENNRDLALQLRIAVSYVHRLPRTVGTQLWLEASFRALGIDCPAAEDKPDA